MNLKNPVQVVDCHSEEQKKLIGHIDLIETGLVGGWASQLENGSPIPVQILFNSEVVAQGIACEFREDLKEAGYGEGKHGFYLPLRPLFSDTNNIKLELIHGESLEKITSKVFRTKLLSSRISGEIAQIEHGQLVASIRCDEPLGKQTIFLFHEHKPVYALDIDTTKNVIEFRAPIPISLQDGKPKLIRLGIKNHPNILAMHRFTCHPIQTPWHYLRESYDQPGILSQPKHADHRYETLQCQLEAISKGNSLQTFEQINTLHKVILEGHSERKKFPNIVLPDHKNPRVSIIVPAYNKFELTYNCIASIAFSFNKTPYEVILADDCSDDQTADAESIIGNLVISRNQENLRFLRNCNTATKLARGEFIVFLNNDTEVTSYWLDELVEIHDKDPNTGLSGAKLLNQDSSLQEAGGIVWKNGQPWNVGRDANPWAPEYNYVREVDYVSGAALCIRTSLWQELNGFSEEFAPCYYEDTDLAFRVREAGYKTVYAPHSTVIHFEGQSHGRDLSRGLKRFQAANEKIFRQKWFACYKNNDKPSLDAMATAKDRNIDQRILVIDYATPMPNKDAGSFAAIQEIRLMQSLGFKVTFAADNVAHFGKYTTELQRMGVEVLYAPFYNSVKDVLVKRLDEMDAIYITRYNVAEKYIDYIKANSQAKILFNNADLHFLRELRSALSKGKDENAVAEALKTREKELAVCRKADAVLCYNSIEHAVITSHILESNKLHITPWVLEEKPLGPSFTNRKNIFFLGNYNHLPNIEAVEYLVGEIMPLLFLKRPDITLSVYGSNMPESFIKYETDNVKVMGFAESLKEVYNSHRIFVAPLLSGAGIKGKVLDAMAYGIPCVVTEIAAEGTGLSDAISTSVAKKPMDWVEAIANLYDNEELWSRYRENQRILVRQRHSFEHGKNVMRSIFESVGLYACH